MDEDTMQATAEPAPTGDRRKRHAHNPTVPITLNIPIALRNALDEVVVEQGWTRSGTICMAVTEWLARHEDAGRARLRVI
jgi:hypothetical protein